MRLNHIDATNLKGPPFAYDLSPAVAIIGPNFAGKTRIIDAIRLALLGYLPELGKTNRATWGLSSGSEMVIKGILKPGAPARSESEFIIESDITFFRRFWLEGTTVKDGLASKPDFNFAQFDTNPLLNASLYFSMTERERTNFVFSAVPLPKGITANSIISSLEQISFEEEHSEAIEKAKRETIQIVHTFIDQAELREGIDAAVARLKDEFSAANRRAKETIGTVRVLTELKNRESEFASAKGLDAEINQAQKDLDAANQAWGGATERNSQATEYQSKSVKLSMAHDFDAEIAKLDTIIAEAKAEIVPEPEVPDVAGVVRKRDELVNSRNLGAAQLKELQKESDRMLKNEECPMCGAEAKVWKTRFATKYATRIKTAAEKIAEIDQEVPVLEAEIEKLFGENEKLRQIRRKNANLQTNIDTWTGRREGIQSRKEAWDKQLDELRHQLEGLPKVERVDENEMNKLDANRKAARQILDELVDRKAIYQRYLQDVKRAAQAAIEHNQAKARLAVTKAVLARLQDVKTVIVEGAFMTLLNVANSIVGPILKSPLAFFENEVGRWEGEKFIGHGTFSGTEQALTFVAIAAALAQQSPLRILIFDELGRLDKKRAFEVTTLLFKALKEGHIDQFIIAGAIEPQLLESSHWNLQMIELK